MRMIYLKDVEVTAKKNSSYALSPVSVIADKTYNYKDIEENKYFSIRDILQRTAGVNISGNQIIMRTRTSIGVDDENPNPEPALYFDDVYIDPAMMNNGLLSFLEELNIYDIKQLDILKTNTVMFGHRGAKGVIYITMKDGSEIVTPNPMYNIQTTSPLGHQPAKEFYSPKYETADQKNINTPDLRTTIYWNPNLKSSLDGEGDFEFYTADMPSTYSVVIEGVTADGQLVHAVEKIRLE